MSKLINDITIIIVLYQENLDLLRNCLKNIKNFKIIIMDNSNNIKLKNQVIKEFKIYKYILNNKNIGFTKAINRVIDLVDTDYIMNLNADCIIKENAILELITAHKKYNNCYIATPTFYDDKNQLTDNSSCFSDKGILQNKTKFEGDVCVDWVIGSAILFKKEDIQNIGMYDENFFLYYLDEDICRRARDMKKSIIQLSSVKAVHSHGISKVKNVFKRVYLRTYNFTYDELYYFFKIGKNNSSYNKIKKNIKSYLFKFIFNIFLFRFSKSIYYFSKIKAFKDFSKKYDH